MILTKEDAHAVVVFANAFSGNNATIRLVRPGYSVCRVYIVPHPESVSVLVQMQDSATMQWTFEHYENYLNMRIAYGLEIVDNSSNNH